MYERVNINCAEVNSTRQMGSGIYFFISVQGSGPLKSLQIISIFATIKNKKMSTLTVSVYVT